jgi:IS5 family transposase
MIQRARELFGAVPRQAAFDGGFTSQDNLTALKTIGVNDVAFSKRRGLAITAMVKSLWVYKRLRNFRAGIEGCISFLKRSFGMTRCTWKGLASFKAYVWSSIVAANLLIIARHLLSTDSA